VIVPLTQSIPTKLAEPSARCLRELDDAVPGEPPEKLSSA
jgi:hypothetical protein